MTGSLTVRLIPRHNLHCVLISCHNTLLRDKHWERMTFICVIRQWDGRPVYTCLVTIKTGCWCVGDFVIKVHLCTPCLNEASAFVDVLFYVCVCLHASRLNYKSGEVLPLSLKKKKLFSICQTYFLNLFSQEQWMLDIIHVMASSVAGFHTPASLHTPKPSSNSGERKTLYCEHNIVQTHFLSSSAASPDSVSNFIVHVFFSLSLSD